MTNSNKEKYDAAFTSAFEIALADAKATIAIHKELGTAVIWESILSRYPFLRDKQIIQLIREGLDA